MPGVMNTFGVAKRRCPSGRGSGWVTSSTAETVLASHASDQRVGVDHLPPPRHIHQQGTMFHLRQELPRSTSPLGLRRERDEEARRRRPVGAGAAGPPGSGLLWSRCARHPQELCAEWGETFFNRLSDPAVTEEQYVLAGHAQRNLAAAPVTGSLFVPKIEATLLYMARIAATTHSATTAYEPRAEQMRDFLRNTSDDVVDAGGDRLNDRERRHLRERAGEWMVRIDHDHARTSPTTGSSEGDSGIVVISTPSSAALDE